MPRRSGKVAFKERVMTRNVVILLLSLGLCATAWGQAPPDDRPARSRGGARHQGPSLDAVPSLMPRLFNALDANGDGFVDGDEPVSFCSLGMANSTLGNRQTQIS